MCVFSSHSFWTSSSLDEPAGVAQEEGHTGCLVYLLNSGLSSVTLFKADRGEAVMPYGGNFSTVGGFSFLGLWRRR